MQTLYACNSISGKLSDQHNSVKRASPISVLEVLRPYIIIQSAQLKAPNGRESQSFPISVPIMWPMKPQTAEIQEECKEPKFLELRSSKWFIVSTICVASFSDSFIYGVVIPVLPNELERRIGLKDEDLEFWNSMLLTAFGLAQLIASPLFGYYADRKRLDTGSQPFFQGLSAAVVYTVGFALLADTVGSKDIGQWMGYVISSLNIGMLISPTIGGIMYAGLGYGSLFIVMFILIAIDIVMRLFMIEKKVAARLKKDKTVAETHTYGTLQQSVDNAIFEQQYPSTPSTSNTASEPLLGSNQNQPPPADNKKHPIALVTLLKSPRIWADLYGVWVTVFLLASFDAALPIFVQRKFNWDSTGAGLIFLAITFPIFLAPMAGRLSDVWPSRWLTASYFIISAVFTVLLVLIHRNSTDQIAGLAVLLTLYGVARVFGSSPLGADLSRAVESMEKKTPGIFGKTGASGQVFSLYTSASAAGVLAGPAWTSYAFGERGWIFFVSSLGILTATVAIPVILFSEPEKSAKGNDVEVVAAE
ncbi:vesicular amine transporter [Botrytis cinerea]